MNRDELRPGATYHVGAACGVPHTFRPIAFRLIAVDPKPTYEHMSWLDGYELDQHGVAVERRTVFVITAGLRLADIPEHAPAPARRRPTNAGPARIPRQRTSSNTPTTTTTGSTR